jgi:sulfate permease, SulP family
MPPITGLYSVILPSVVYLLFGTCMQLGVGPVALVALLTGGLMDKYEVPYTTDTAAAVIYNIVHYRNLFLYLSQMNFAAQVCICNGILMTFLGILNMGSFIRFISHPVMCGFTNAAALIIALNQINAAFGFPSSSVPQVSTSRHMESISNHMP